MPMEVQSFTCPRCRRGEFRSIPGPDGKAFCPWCGDSVGPGSAAPESAPLPEFSLEELAERIASKYAAPPTAQAAPDLDTRLAESERRREAAEAELRRELEKKQEIKKAVQAEIARLEAELAEARDRVRRKDQEHAAALQDLNLLKTAREDQWNGDRMRLQFSTEEKEKALRTFEARLVESQKSASEFRQVLDASRAEVGRLHAEVAAAQAERSELRRKLSAADGKLQSLKEAPAQLEGLKHRLQESQAKGAGLQAELDKRDRRIKELQLLVKTLGERLNDLADRPQGRPSKGS